jgi:hypothetical protein
LGIVQVNNYVAENKSNPTKPISPDTENGADNKNITAVKPTRDERKALKNKNTVDKNSSDNGTTKITDDASKKNAAGKNNTDTVATARLKTKDEKTTTRQETKKVDVSPQPVKLAFDQRKTNITQTVETAADSLVLAFYDNGVVDGDSVSVYMNGVNIVASTRLTTVATKKTIAVTGLDEIQILLVAENLGTLPPNTGLLTIKDGDRVYQVNFSADMQTNAAILIRRKKK